jgi:hypothetical protein
MAERAELLLTARDQTAGAFATAQRNIQNLQAAVAGAFGGGAFAAFQAGAEKAFAVLEHFDPRGVINAAEQLNKLSQRSGIGVEQLGALQFAAKLADVSVDDLAGSLKRLNVNIAAAARGEQEQADAFRTIGVAVKDANGQVRSAEEVLGDIAEKFESYKNGANKVALANALGGKSFEHLIPLLNNGRKGIEDARVELDKLGGTINADLARKSEEFNDNLVKLGVAADKLKVAIASGLIDRLVDFSQTAVDAAKNGGLLQFSLEKLGELFSGRLTREFVFGKSLEPAKLTEAQQEVERLSNLVIGLQNNLDRDPGNAGLARRLERLTEQLKQAKTSLEAEAGVSERDLLRRTEKKGSDFSAAPRPKKDAPALGTKTGADDAAALLRKQLEGRIKIIQAGLERERDLFQFHDQQLAELFAHGELSIAQFYDEKSKSQQDFLLEQQRGFDDEIKALRDFQAKATKPQDRQDAENRINDVLAQQAKTYREAGQAAQVSEQQRVRASQEFERSLKDLDATLSDLSGDKFNAELLRNARTLFDAQQLLSKKTGGDPARLQALTQLLAVQAEVNRAVDQTGRVTDRAAIAEAQLALEAERSGLSRSESEARITRIREAEIVQLDAEIARLQAIGRLSEDQQITLDKLKLQRDQIFDAKDPGVLRFRDSAREAGDLIAHSFEDAAIQGGKLSDIIKQLEDDLARLVIRKGLTEPLSDSITGFIKDVGKGAGIGASTSSGGGGVAGGLGALGPAFLKLLGLGGAGGSALTSTGLEGLSPEVLSFFFHGGGIVGSGSGTLRKVNPAVFEHAERFHRGGIAGLGPDEVPIIARKREEILREDDPRHRDNASRSAPSLSVTNHFTVTGPVDRRSEAQIAAAAYGGAQRAFNRGA